jgi:hypothetical protein
MKVIKNLLTESEIKELLEYHSIVDDRTDSRPDVVSKHPKWDIDIWPQDTVRRILDNVLDDPYIVDEVIFNQSKISFRLHADSGHSVEEKNGWAILVPLKVTGVAHTVFFDNFWHGPSTKFSKRQILPFEYQLQNKNNEWQYVEDVRNLRQDILDGLVTNFNITVKELDYIISARQNQKISKVDNRCYDYTDVINYNEDLKFDTEIHQKYLNHLEIETVDGLTIHDIVEWVPSDVIVFERSRLHCASSCHNEKIGITIFVR